MLANTMSAPKLGCNAKPLAAQRAARSAPRASLRVAASAASGEVPDMGKRTLMNGLLLGAVGLPAASLAGGFAYFFVPPSCAPARAADCKPVRLQCSGCRAHAACWRMSAHECA